MVHVDKTRENRFLTATCSLPSCVLLQGLRVYHNGKMVLVLTFYVCHTQFLRIYHDGKAVLFMLC